MVKVRKDGIFEFILKIIGSLEPEDETTVTVPAGETYAIPKGIHYVIPGPNTSIEITTDGTTWRSLGTGNASLVISNGVNTRLSNGGTAAEDSIIITLG